MAETTAEYHRLLLALAGAGQLVADVPLYDIRSEVDELKLRSYVFLIHAAVEEYLENLSRFAVSESLRLYQLDGRMRLPLLSLMGHYSISLPASFIGPRRYKDELLLAFFSARNRHELAVSDVNGIKTKDQDAVLMPIGICVHEFDRVLSQKLHALGENRGEIAHRYRIKTKVPRAGLETNTLLLAKLLLPLDNAVCERTNWVVAD